MRGVYATFSSSSSSSSSSLRVRTDLELVLLVAVVSWYRQIGRNEKHRKKKRSVTYDRRLTALRRNNLLSFDDRSRQEQDPFLFSSEYNCALEHRWTEGKRNSEGGRRKKKSR